MIDTETVALCRRKCPSCREWTPTVADSYPVAIYVFWGDWGLDTRTDYGAQGVMGSVKGKIASIFFSPLPTTSARFTRFRPLSLWKNPIATGYESARNFLLIIFWLLGRQMKGGIGYEIGTSRMTCPSNSFVTRSQKAIKLVFCLP